MTHYNGIELSATTITRNCVSRWDEFRDPPPSDRRVPCGGRRLALFEGLRACCTVFSYLRAEEDDITIKLVLCFDVAALHKPRPAFSRVRSWEFSASAQKERSWRCCHNNPAAQRLSRRCGHLHDATVGDNICRVTPERSEFRSTRRQRREKTARELVHLIKEAREASHQSNAEIAKCLNEKGFRARLRGGRLSPEATRRILNDIKRLGLGGWTENCLTGIDGATSFKRVNGKPWNSKKLLKEVNELKAQKRREYPDWPITRPWLR